MRGRAAGGSLPGGRPATHTPTSSAAVRPRTSARLAATAQPGVPALAASALPLPTGTWQSGRPAAADRQSGRDRRPSNSSAAVPSPPSAASAPARAGSAPPARRAAWPGPVVTTGVASMPAAARSGATVRDQVRPALPAPEAGLRTARTERGRAPQPAVTAARTAATNDAAAAGSVGLRVTPSTARRVPPRAVRARPTGRAARRRRAGGAAVAAPSSSEGGACHARGRPRVARGEQQAQHAQPPPPPPSSGTKLAPPPACRMARPPATGRVAAGVQPGQAAAGAPGQTEEAAGGWSTGAPNATPAPDEPALLQLGAEESRGVADLVDMPSLSLPLCRVRGAGAGWSRRGAAALPKRCVCVCGRASPSPSPEPFSSKHARALSFLFTHRPHPTRTTLRPQREALGTLPHRGLGRRPTCQGERQESAHQKRAL